MENEGYLGRINHPARSNHRVIRFQMEENDWGFQYSPYAYFNEHSIFFYGKHEPMHISPLTFGRLLSIVEAFPGYFAGSNADLPIVGGSILTHEHYQGGRHTFPMEVAGIKEKVSFDGYSDVETGIVNWPMSVLRLRSEDKERLIALATKILNCWRGYSAKKLVSWLSLMDNLTTLLPQLLVEKTANLNWIWFFVTIKLLKNIQTVSTTHTKMFNILKKKTLV